MLDEDALISELSFKAVRSSGAGGQHVNKVSSKVELTFYLLESSALNEEQKALLIKPQSVHQHLVPHRMHHNSLYVLRPINMVIYSWLVKRTFN